MIGSPMRFQAAVAVISIGGVLLVTDAQGKPEPQPVFAFQDTTIDESSGLVDLGARVVTTNDSGDGPVVYVVDRSTGETVGRTTYTSDEVVDVEALAPGVDGTLWVGDIGDNPWQRASVAVYELPMPTEGDATVQAQRYELVYEGGPRDAEALLVHPVTGRLYVVSKGVFGGQLFAAPARLSTDRANVLRPGSDVGGLVTDGAFFPDGRFLALRSYSNLTVLSTDGWRDVGGMTLPDQNQGEGLAVVSDADRVLVSTEGAGSEVLEVPLSRAIRDRIAPPEPSPSASPSTSPSTSPSASPDDSGDVTVSFDETELHVTPLWQVAAGAGVLLLGVVLWRRRKR